ncbi:MAG TPA: P1 family peptidase [Candidatus Agathobaculum merdavium]|nr:P1 family peptidase [Candidatus Agathobaculum merdavium]
MQEIGFLEVGGFQVGQAEDAQAGTGVTVLLFDECAPAGVDIRGGGPASRETPLLAPVADAAGLHALVLSGGSAFGLDAAGGVMRFLEERGIGFDTGITPVPLVAQSCIFDLAIGDKSVRPDGAMAYRACENASRTELALGCVGGGMGATVGKFCGAPYAMKSGIGAYAVQAGAIRVGAIVVVNALGDIFDVDTSRQIAGLRTEDGRGLRSTEEQLYAGIEVARNPFSANKTATNTTIGAIVTNAAFSKAELTRVASTAHNGFARAIRPVHTTADGDSIYACSVGREKADLNAVATLASYVMAKAIGVGVRAARDGFGLPCAQTLGTV